jgi:hypothetical protein
MRISNPCKICIVQPMCNKMCPEREDLGRTYLKICQSLSLVLIFMGALLITIMFDDNREVVKKVAVILFTTSLISIITQLILRGIRKSNKRMFERRFGELRVYGFER